MTSNVNIKPSMSDSDSSSFECFDSNNSNSDFLNENDSTLYKCNESDSDSSSFEKIKFTTLFRLTRENKKAVIDWLMSMGLIPSEYFCAKCGKPMKLIEKKGISDGYAWFCRTRGSNGHVSSRTVRTGSWFSKSRMNLCEILMLIHCWVYQLPLEWVLLELGCSQTTVYEWFSNCRDICTGLESISKIGGDNKTVEIDETEINYKTRKGEGTEIIIGGIERGSRNFFLKAIGSRDIESLVEVIKRNISPGTTIISHCMQSYECFDSKSFVDLVASNKYSFKKPAMGSSTTFDNLWEDLKHFIPMPDDKFDSCLAEYVWRKNNCHSQDKMKCFVEAIKVVFPLCTSDDP